jgi:hypothetical protein
MSTNPTLIALIVHEAKPAAEKFGTLEERLTAAFKAAKSHFMGPDDSTALIGGLCAVHEISSPEDQERIVKAKHALDALSAMLNGIPVDMGAVDTSGAPLPLMDLYRNA